MLLLTKIIFTAIGSWSLALILVFINPVPVSGFAGILSVPVAAVLMILTLIALLKERRRRWPVVCAALILAVFFIALPRVMYWGALVHLYLHKRSYGATAQSMLAAKNEADRQRICGEKCWLLYDRERVAFHYVHGFLNWHDIIYDPSGKLLTLKSWDDKKRFDMYFVSAEHLTGDWYLGHFGD
jgi:hypothetical protein